MSPSSTPITAPTESVRIVRQGRHAAVTPLVSEPGFDHALAQLLSDDESVPSDRPLVVKQRIARDRDALRRLRRTLPDLTEAAQRFETEEKMRFLARRIRHGRQALELLVRSGRARIWGPSDFEPGDQARFLSAWCDVLDIGPAGLTVRLSRPHGGDWDVPAEYAKVTGRRRDGVEDVDAA